MIRTHFKSLKYPQQKTLQIGGWGVLGGTILSQTPKMGNIFDFFDLIYFTAKKVFSYLSIWIDSKPIVWDSSCSITDNSD